MLDSIVRVSLSAFAASCKRIMLGVAMTGLAAAPALGAIATDAILFRDRSNAATNITSPAFSTTSANELLLAFVSADANSAGITVTSVTGAGLTWQLVRRSNAQLGTAEIFGSAAIESESVFLRSSRSAMRAMPRASSPAA